MKTEEQFDKVIEICKNLFSKKLLDYGAAWRIMRQESVTDQLFIKASRIRYIEQNKETKVNEGIYSELIGLINYSIIGLIQIDLGCSDDVDMTREEALNYYDKKANSAKELMQNKNHDYSEAWRLMRVESYTDLILQKINRTKTIEDNHGNTIVSEGIDANYYDIINYAVFYVIKILERGGKL